MERVRRFIVTHLWWMVLLVALVMLAGHSFGVKAFVVDNTSLILLALVLISPLLAAVRKVKFGEFEAEIQPEEVKRVTQQVEKSLPPPQPTPVAPQTSEASAAIKSLAETDPVIALAKLRIEIESRVRRLYQRSNPIGQAGKRPPTLNSMIRELIIRETLGEQLGVALSNIVGISNRAIHGEDIRDVDARQIINTVGDLLEYLDWAIREYPAMNPVEKKVITQQELDEFLNARYRLTTMIPYTKNPQERVYLVNQDELNAFLDGYSECAEFIVRLERIEAGVKGAKNTNFAAHLLSVPDKVFKAANGWELSDKGRVYVAEMTAVVWSQSPAAIEAKALRNLLPKLKNEGCRAFLTEAIVCTERSLFRAAVVLSWVGAVALLYEEAVTNHLAALNAEATRRDSKWKSAKNTDDLGRMKEATFLEIAGAISMIGKNVKQELRLVSSCVMRVGIQTL